MPDTLPGGGASSTIALSVHGDAGVIDIVVPVGATSVDVARHYAAKVGAAGIPLLQSPTGRLLTADRALVDLGVQTGDTLVVTSGVHRGKSPRSLRDLVRGSAETPALAGLIAAMAAGLALLAAVYAARSGDDLPRTVTVGVLLVCALGASLPFGRHLQPRRAASPAFGGAAALAALYEPGSHLLPAIVAAVALSGAVVAGIARALADDSDEVLSVWIVAGLTVALVCALSPMFGWSPRVSWALLVFLSLMASRFAPSLAIDVPDEALLDLDRLAVTAWSARERAPGSKRGRVVVSGEAMERLVASASRTVTAATAAIAAVMSVAAPLLLKTAVIDLDRIGARCLVFFASCGILLAARSYRLGVPRALLRFAGLVGLVSLGFHFVAARLAGELAASWVTWFFVGMLALGLISMTAAVATGRGWRSVWWSRKAEVAESFCGSFAFAATVVAAGVFRSLWEMTS